MTDSDPIGTSSGLTDSAAVGVVLAAGAGRRMGQPKALIPGWLPRAVESLAGCDETVVVLGAAAPQAQALLRAQQAQVVVARDWAQGMGASLRAGLRWLIDHEMPRDDRRRAVRAVVTLVDLPDVGRAVVDRMLQTPAEPGILARASYHGRPGHPVILGREHWSAVLATSGGDRGARDYLRAHQVSMIECGDLASGADSDHPDS